MRKGQIQGKAEAVLRDHNMIEMVVDPVRIANRLGVKVFNAQFGQENIHGLIAVRDGVPTIYVNKNDSPARKRFTVAHELGHLLLHLNSEDGEFIDNKDNFRTPVDPDSAWTPERRQEWEANVFAASLLMPEAFIRRMWSELEDVREMARFFQVSEQAMTLRLDALGLEA